MQHIMLLVSTLIQYIQQVVVTLFHDDTLHRRRSHAGDHVLHAAQHTSAE
jgi:hypothetical protein